MIRSLILIIISFLLVSCNRGNIPKEYFDCSFTMSKSEVYETLKKQDYKPRDYDEFDGHFYVMTNSDYDFLKIENVEFEGVTFEHVFFYFWENKLYEIDLINDHIDDSMEVLSYFLDKYKKDVSRQFVSTNNGLEKEIHFHRDGISGTLMARILNNAIYDHENQVLLRFQYDDIIRLMNLIEHNKQK